MQLIGRTTKKLTELFISNGWGFLIPYLALYLWGWYFEISVDHLVGLFWALHLFFIVLLFTWLIPKILKKEISIFWIFIFLLFLLPGAYLEFPSDAWTHVLRILRWQTFEVVSEHTQKAKMPYFWMWTWISHLQPIQWRMGFNILSAFNQLLVAIQVYRLSRRLGFSKPWSHVQVFAFVAFFGTNIFGLRYYGLSTLPFSFTAFLASLEWTLSEKALWGRKFFGLFTLLVFMIFSHREEALLFFIIVAGLGLSQGLQKLIQWRKSQTLWGLAFLLGIQFVVGYYYFHLRPQFFSSTGELSQFTNFGNFKVWHEGHRYRDTLGLHGLVALLFALVFFKKARRLSVLTWTGTLTLLMPLTVIAVILLFHRTGQPDGLFYRILYAFPTSFIFVYGFREILGHLKISHSWSEQKKILAVFVVVLLFGIIPTRPWLGRLYFAVSLSNPERNLQYLDETVQWFKQNRKILEPCPILSDPLSGYALNAFLGTHMYYNRLNPDTISPVKELIEKNKTCGILLVDPSQLSLGQSSGLTTGLPEFLPSKIAQLAGHWNPSLADLRWYQNQKVALELQDIVKVGSWKRTPVPPFYTFYEP